MISRTARQSLLFCLAVILFLLTCGAASLFAQASTGTISGRISDPSGAAVPGARVILVYQATGTARSGVTNRQGLFTFPNLALGSYRVTITARGFKTLVVRNVPVTVQHVSTENLTLQVGAATTNVTVEATPGAELRTTSSSVGTTIPSHLLQLLPNQHRDATGIILTQPMTIPATGNSDTGGAVAGQMSDQNTFVLDGANITNDTDGSGQYTNGFSSQQQGAIPTPVESIQQVRVASNNFAPTANASAGGEVILVTKRGTNEWHGSLYDFYQADELNAAGWNLNRQEGLTGGQVTKQELLHNRFGAALGGTLLPKMLGGKTYFYFNYEGRRFPNNQVFSHNVPSQQMRDGVLQFRDGNGKLISYNLNPANGPLSAACGATGGQACDPRGLGLNPVVAEMWNKYMPAANTPAGFSSLNRLTYDANLSLPIQDDFSVMRIDHDFGPNWRFMAVYRWFRELAPTTSQIDFGGLLPGDKLGVPTAVSSHPLQPASFVAGLTTTITPMLTNDFHFSYLRHWWSWQTAGWPAQISGIPDALEIGSGDTSSAMIPMNINAQDSRWRIWDGHDWGYRDDMTWLTGNHLVQFGGDFTHYWIHHVRTDDVIGAVPALVSQINANGLRFPANYMPPVCGSSAYPGQSNCITSSEVGAWQNDYADVLGIVGQTNILVSRTGANLNLNPLGTPLEDTSTYPNIDLYFSDTWRATPSLTFVYGLGWGVQMPPYEASGKQTMMVANGQSITMQQYFANRYAAFSQGQVYNPVIGFEPVGALGRKYPYNPDYRQWSPRVAFAWNPQANGGVLGWLFGNGAGVIRGGYSRIYNRLNGVSLIMTPLLGPSFGQTISCQGPSMSGACLGTSSATPATAFRIGVDGNTAPLPAIPQTLALPVEPGVNASSSPFNFFLDTAYKPGSTDEWDLSYQRQLTNRLILEVGYVGDVSRDLYQGLDFNTVPWFMKYGGQTFANAYDNVYSELATGAPVTPQPFFEAALAGSQLCQNGSGAAVACGTAGANFPNYTQAAVNYVGASTFTQNYVSSIWLPLDNYWKFGHTMPATQGATYVYGECSCGWSNYNAGFISLNARDWHGLTLDMNLTYSHNFSTAGITQSGVLDNLNNPWNLGYDYGPAYWDRPFTFNTLALYQLPFGRGQRGVIGHLIGGWSIAPIWTWDSGLPLPFWTGSFDEFGNGGPFAFGSGANAVPLVSTSSIASTQGTYPIWGTSASSNGVATAGNPATGGTGLNYFANPSAVYSDFRPALVGLDTTSGGGGYLRGYPSWNVDLTLSKDIQVTERVGATFTAQAFNVFNHVVFSDPFLSLQDAPGFGVIGGQANAPRQIELGLRIHF